VDIPKQTLEVHTAPSDAGYDQVRYFERGQSLAPAALPTCAISVDQMLAP
jgi:hypothetical protein